MKKKKVCHITSAHKSNDIRIFIKQSKSLAKMGYETHYIVPNAKTEIIENVCIHGITNKLQSRLNRMLITTREVYKKAIEINAEVYHFHDPELIPIGLKLKRRGKKVIYDVHEDVAATILNKTYIKKPFRKIISRVFEKYENYAIKKFDYILTATPFIANKLKTYNENTIDINNYPILDELFSINEKDVKKNQLSYVGGISKPRGILQIIEASKKIHGTIKLAGPVSNEKTLELIQSSENIEYLSILEREEVKRLLNESLAGIVTFLPAPNHINAQPNKLFEYMSAGIAVIGSDFPLWKDIIEGNNCGLCVNPESEEEIFKAIEYILENKEEVIQMGKNGRKAVEEMYNWEQEEKKLLQVYKELLS